MKTLDKYGTLPRRRKEKSSDSIQRTPKNAESSRESSLTRGSVLRSRLKESSGTKVLPPYPRRKVAKTKIYHEIGSQTVLTVPDIDRMCEGAAVNPGDPRDAEKMTTSVQVDLDAVEMDKLRRIAGKYEMLLGGFGELEGKLRETERQLANERMEKEGLRDELKQNSDRVLAILGQDRVASNNGKCLVDIIESRYLI